MSFSFVGQVQHANGLVIRLDREPGCTGKSQREYITPGTDRFVLNIIRKILENQSLARLKNCTGDSRGQLSRIHRVGKLFGQTVVRLETQFSFKGVQDINPARVE